jgi:hypothetical protein
MRSLLVSLLVIFISHSPARAQKTKVLALGVFHFAFPNLDIKKTKSTDQIDVLDKKYQDEIENIATHIAKFKPTIIAIERDPSAQPKYDSLYRLYLAGTYSLTRDEEQQIGFRIAKKSGLQKLYCVNDWGRNYEVIDSLLDKDSVAEKKFEAFFYKNPDSTKMYFSRDIFKKEGIKAELRMLNDPRRLQKDLGNYLVGVFKYEIPDNKFFGADFTTGWWFNRNLRIFRNIQKIGAGPTDRVLVIFGAGHMNLLTTFFNASPEFELVRTNDYLR